VSLQTCSSTGSKCISEFTRSQPPSASPKSLDYDLQVHLQTHRSQPPSVSLYLHDHSLQNRSITASKYICKYAPLPPPSAPPNWLDHGVVGKRLPPLQSHAIERVRDWVRVIAALHHAIDKVEYPTASDTTNQTSPITYLSSSHLFSSSLFCFLVLANQLSRCGYSLPTLLETKPPFS